MKYNPVVIKALTLEEASKELEGIGCDENSIPIMAPKAVCRMIKLHGVDSVDAIIIKQEMLSCGGDAALPRDIYFGERRNVDIMVIGTIKQIREAIIKLRRQYSRLQEISLELERVLEGEL